MLVENRIRTKHFWHYNWVDILYFTGLSIAAYLLHWEFDFDLPRVTLPFEAVALLSTALAIYLGFKSNQAYDRWWEGRKIWGLLVNYSRAFGREVLTFPDVPSQPEEQAELRRWQESMVLRHAAFVHGLRVFLRKPNGFVAEEAQVVENSNTYDDMRPLISDEEFEATVVRRNPPNHLNRIQGEQLAEARRRGWLSDYRFVQLSETLAEFNNHQGKAERIKNTPLPRPFSIYSRIFVLVHGTLVPFAFVDSLGLMNIPLSLTINLFFLSIDRVGRYVEDPFENRPMDVPIGAISRTIEENLKELLDREDLPAKGKPVEGIVF